MTNNIKELRTLQYDELKHQSFFEGEIEEDIRFGSGLIIKNNKYDLKLLLQTQSYTLSKHYNDVIDKCQLRMQLNIPTLLHLIKYNGTEYNQSYRISLLNEFLQYTLQDEMKVKSFNGELYTESNIYRILDNVMAALFVLHQSGIQHNFIQPSTIFTDFSSEYIFYHLYKINDIFFLSGQSEYGRFMGGQRQECYLSPKLLRELGQRVEIPNHNQEKSEVFSLGLTLLSLCFNKDLTDQIYDFNEFQINSLNGLLHGIEDIYSPRLCKLIREMTMINEDERIGYDQIVENCTGQSLEGNNETLITHEQKHQVSPLSFKQTTQMTDLDQLFFKYDYLATSASEGKSFGKNNRSCILSIIFYILFRKISTLMHQYIILFARHNNNTSQNASQRLSGNYTLSPSPKPFILAGNVSHQPQSPLRKLEIKKTMNIPKQDFTFTSEKFDQSELIQKMERQGECNVFIPKWQSGSKLNVSSKGNQDTVKQARLPESDLIHLHSGNQQFLNDTFCSKQKQFIKQPQDFWL